MSLIMANALSSVGVEFQYITRSPREDAASLQFQKTPEASRQECCEWLHAPRQFAALPHLRR